MSRRITIATEMTREDLVAESLTELEADFTKEGTKFTVSAVNGSRFRYTGAFVDTAKPEVGFDEDDRAAKSFVTNQLFQTYNKNLTLDTMLMEGHQVDEQFVANATTYIEGVDIIEDGDYVIRARANF